MLFDLDTPKPLPAPSAPEALVLVAAASAGPAVALSTAYAVETIRDVQWICSECAAIAARPRGVSPSLAEVFTGAECAACGDPATHLYVTPRPEF